MASGLFKQLKEFGFSEGFLKSTTGCNETVRIAVLTEPSIWRTCRCCKKKYGDLNSLRYPLPVDEKVTKPASHVRKAGFCCTGCADQMFGAENRDIAIKGYFLALRPDFYETREWREVRYAVLEHRKGRCECCGRTAKDGIVIHVDHIKPRSKHPHLALDPNNLQILCADCNLGKGASYETDWRSDGAY